MAMYEAWTTRELMAELRSLDSRFAEAGRRMTDWEVEFLDSVLRQFDELNFISQKQKDIVIKILRKYE